ncbi:threonine-phosphate decarboxylase CobD [Roseovarius sp. Pro17]|uniref:threonine-phosphate decarboxylase CobD n=1 Tax=Roseovarius sp. Pro17 TaxID=3108175 RepID=UPI002D7A14BE|nr:threonine-phosphate decarboxylase CobD [Roseovarius sp. Pro17]
MRDHGGNIDAAVARFGGTDWIDLSTGINRVPYPVPVVPIGDWTMLPTNAAKSAALAAARAAYRTDAPMLATAGAQAAIQMIPRFTVPGKARVLGPTYNEHAAALRAAGWQVRQVTSLDQLAGADLAVVVNPNKPDGRSYAAADLQDLTKETRIVVDESFGDPQPDLSLAPSAGAPGLIILRSFGKFYGLAGLRLGFVIGCSDDIARLDEMAGPWPVNGAALRIATQALTDRAWAEATTLRLRAEAAMADALAKTAGWTVVGGTELFRLYETPDAKAAQERLAQHQIWSRIFPYSAHWLRIGLPGGEAEWKRLARALEG